MGSRNSRGGYESPPEPAPFPKVSPGPAQGVPRNRRPRIFKGAYGWIVQMPPYGFNRYGEFIGPFTSWRAALRWLGRRGGASAAQQIQANTQQPSYQYAAKGLRPVIR